MWIIDISLQCLFKELRILKLLDSIELKTTMLMYKANNFLPLNIQRLFSVHEVTYYNTRQLTNMKQTSIYQNNIIVKMYIYLWCKTLELGKNGP